MAQAHSAHEYTKAKSMQMQSIVASLLKFRVDGMQKICKACQMGKQARHAFPCNAEVSNRALEPIHFDVWTTKVASLSGCHYYVSFIDDHTRKVWVYFMIRSDGGGENFSKEFSDYLKEQGFQRK